MQNLPVIQIDEPCTKDWDGMSGTDQQRFCDTCDKHVLNFSEMSAAEVNQAMSSAGDTRVCARIQRKPDGSIVTRDSRSKLRRSLLSRVSQFAALATACVLAGCGTKEPEPPAIMGAVGPESPAEVESKDANTPEDQLMEMGEVCVAEDIAAAEEKPLVRMGKVRVEQDEAR